ncbi:hypothetical protein [Bacillus andreraoultii]|uniref:hypothetical protein n=1 Tax=Bacillus andreraoultii TaxID=1499685 RepID=UPI00053B0723|nr:hypothetical protein [Bacillus andreraoultii]
MNTNKAVIESKINEWNMTVGSYDETMELLSEQQLKRVIEKAEYGSGDVEIILNKKRYIVEIFHVDNEIDFNVMTKSQYVNTYGNNK